MLKFIRLSVVIVMVFSMIFCANSTSYTQDDEGGGGDVGDIGGSDIGDSGMGDSDTLDVQEEYSEETQYEESSVPDTTATSVTTSTTHTYVPGGYVYDNGTSAVVGAAVGAGVGAAVGSAVAGTGKSGAVSGSNIVKTEKTEKRPIIIKKKPVEKTADKDKEDKKAEKTSN